MEAGWEGSRGEGLWSEEKWRRKEEEQEMVGARACIAITLTASHAANPW